MGSISRECVFTHSARIGSRLTRRGCRSIMVQMRPFWSGCVPCDIRIISCTDLFRLKVGVYFNEVEHSGKAMKYVPRSVQIDLEAGVCDRVCAIIPSKHFRLCIDAFQIRGGPRGGLFRPDTFLTGGPGAGNNWAKGCGYLLSLRYLTKSTTYLSVCSDYTEGSLRNLIILYADAQASF